MSPRRSLFVESLRATALLLCGASAACGPPEVLILPSPQAPSAPIEPDMVSITEAQAQERGLVGTPLSVGFSSADEDGTRMTSEWLDAARRMGSHTVGSIELHVVRPQKDDLVECRTTFYPENTIVPTNVPGGPEVVNVTRPVLRPEMHMEQRCQLVPTPVTVTETTSVMQYNAFTHSMSSMPQTHLVTHTEMRNQCHSQSVTRMETRWEFVTETRFAPPRMAFLTERKLKETAPECYVAAPGATSRVDGQVYSAPAPKAEHPRE